MSTTWWQVDQDQVVTEFTDRVNLTERNLSVTTNAEQMSVGTSTLVVDDPDGDWDLAGHRPVAGYETECSPGYALLWYGYAAEREISRQTYRTGEGRKWAVTLTDLNTIFDRRVETGVDCNRPAETDVERMQWLLSTSEAGLIVDYTYFSTSDPVDLDAADYRGQKLMDVVTDCTQQSGKNCYLLSIFDDPAYLIGIWYDFAELHRLLV